MVEVSSLSKKELKAHDFFIVFAALLSELSDKSRNKVFHRFRMLHMLNEREEKVMRDWIERINNDFSS